MPITTAQRRIHYDAFVADVIDLCATKSIRKDLASGRGRPAKQCDRIPKHLTRLIAGYGARRAHYTVASLIAIHRDLDDDGPYMPETALADAPPRQPNITSAADAPVLDQPDTLSSTAGRDTGLRDVWEAARVWRRRPNLGTSLAIAVARHGFKEVPMERDVKVLTRLPTPLLHPRLWTLTNRLHAKGASRLDFAVLLEDLARWDYDTLTIADRWRDDYFGTLHILDQSKEP